MEVYKGASISGWRFESLPRIRVLRFGGTPWKKRGLLMVRMAKCRAVSERGKRAREALVMGAAVALYIFT